MAPSHDVPLPEIPYSRERAILASSDVARIVCDALGRFKVSAGARQYAAGHVAATMCEQLIAVATLLGSPAQGQAEVVARGMVESALDLEIICNGSDADFASLRFSSATGASNFAEQYLKCVDSASDGERQLAAARARDLKAFLSELRAQGGRRLRIEDKVKRAPILGARFWPFYCAYCSPAHNDLDALRARHRRGRTITVGARLADDRVRVLLTVCTGLGAAIFEFMPRFMKVTAEQLEPLCEPILAVVRRIARMDAREDAPGNKWSR